MKVLFYTRPWLTELHLAIERHWAERGLYVDASYVTQHVEVRDALLAAGRRVTFLPDAFREADGEDPWAVLDRFAERYGDKLVPDARYALSERFISRWSGRRQVKEVARQLVAIERLFERERPEIMVSEGVDTMPGWLSHDLAIAWDCAPLGLSTAPLPRGRLLRIRRHDEIWGARETYEELRQRALTEDELDIARRLQAIVRGEGTKPDYKAYSRDWADFARRALNGAILRHHVDYSVWQWRERLAGNYFVQKDQFVRRAQQPFMEARARIAETRLFTEPLPTRPFLFYPLHMEPEAALLVNGSYYEDQINLIRNLARSLPTGWELVVKEHPWMRSYRSLRFLRRLQCIPKVRIVPMATPSNVLVQKAEAIATVVSSVGLEASLIGRPVIVFGEIGWDHAPGVRHIGRMADLPQLLRDAHTHDLGPDHPDVLAFAASWNASLPHGRHHKHREYDWLEPENVANVAAAIEDVYARAGADRRAVGELP